MNKNHRFWTSVLTFYKRPFIFFLQTSYDWFHTTMYIWFTANISIFHFVLAQLKIKIAHSSSVFSTCVQFCPRIVAFYFWNLLAANILSWPQKVGPHAQHQPIHRFLSHQQSIDHNNQWHLQSPLNKVLTFK